jgi:xanthine dehydrogenase YagR molybdenum-binding subunit
MPQTGKKRKIKVPKVVNGKDTIVEIEVDDTGGPTWGAKNSHTILNHGIERVDGPAKVSGAARYAYDVRLPGMLYGCILASPHPSAKVLKVDFTAAEKMPGVKVVIRAGDDTLKYEGDPVAAVAAATPEIAEDAIRAIRVEYKQLPHVVNLAQALQPKAPEVYSKGGPGNIRIDKKNGDRKAAEAALKSCAVVVEHKFTIPMQHHVCLETHGNTIDYRGGQKATVYASTQGTFTIPGDAAKELGIPAQNITSIVEYMGGGFGSKFGLDLAGVIGCQLSKKAGAPVKLMLTRTQEYLMAGNRNGAVQIVQAGADRDGKLLAMVAVQYQDGGLGDGGLADLPYIYDVKTVYNQNGKIHTHKDASVAMRGPGHPQVSFAMEAIIDDLAAAIGMDPIEFRKKNTNDEAYHRQLDTGAKAISWESRPKVPGAGPKYGPFQSLQRGIGCGLATWGGGGHPECKVDVFIQQDGAVAVQVGTQDLGTGSRTYTAAIVAEEFGLPVKGIETRIGRSTYGQANASGGSTTTGSLAPAVKDAAFNARVQLLAKVAPLLGARSEELILRDGKVYVEKDPAKSLTWKQACAALGMAGITARGEWKEQLQGDGVHGAQFAEVEVDTETGQVRVLKMVGVQDCGLALNRTAVESQINGGMIQALGYALLENHVVDGLTGHMLNATMDEYKLPGCFEIPEMIPIIDDGDTRAVPIGMAEPAAIPGASAIANAVYNACGVRVISLPITPDKILDGLAKLKRA